jgi:hypothetical protein
MYAHLAKRWALTKNCRCYGYIKMDWKKQKSERSLDSRSAVSKFLKRFDQWENIENKPRTGRPRSTTKQGERTFIRLVKQDRRRSLRDFTHMNFFLDSTIFHQKILFYSIVLVLSSVVYFGTTAHDFFIFNEIVSVFATIQVDPDLRPSKVSVHL